MAARKSKPREKSQPASTPIHTGDDGAPVVVIGDGWAALAIVGYLAAVNRPVHWVAGTGSRILAPLPMIEAGEKWESVPAVWGGLARALGIEPGAFETGNYLREFRNKAFREPLWTKSPTPEMRAETRDEIVWGPERMLAPVFEGRYALPLSDLELMLRERLVSDNFASLRRSEGVPVADILLDGDRVRGVRLADGVDIPATKVIYADRWNELTELPSLPKAELAFARRREPTGVLQAVLTHAQPMGAGLQEGFFGDVNRDPGEEIDRHVWGHFSADGTRSVWTLCMAPEEVEDNHLIAKKLRRMKNALDKMFAGSAWLPEGKADFMANVASEQVRFEEAAIFSEGEAPAEPIRLFADGALCFLTDGYGPSSALLQAGLLLPELGLADVFARLSAAPVVAGSEATGGADESAGAEVPAASDESSGAEVAAQAPEAGGPVADAEGVDGSEPAAH